MQCGIDNCSITLCVPIVFTQLLTLPSLTVCCWFLLVLWHFYADFILASKRAVNSAATATTTATATSTAACQRNLLKIYLSAQLLLLGSVATRALPSFLSRALTLYVCAVMQLITHIYAHICDAHFMHIYTSFTHQKKPGEIHEIIYTPLSLFTLCLSVCCFVVAVFIMHF